MGKTINIFVSHAGEDEHRIDSKIHQYFPEARIVVIPEILPGPVYTARAGVDTYIDNYPIIINSLNHSFIYD